MPVPSNWTSLIEAFVWFFGLFRHFYCVEKYNIAYVLLNVVKKMNQPSKQAQGFKINKHWSQCPSDVNLFCLCSLFSVIMAICFCMYTFVLVLPSHVGMGFGLVYSGPLCWYLLTVVGMDHCLNYHGSQLVCIIVLISIELQGWSEIRYFSV